MSIFEFLHSVERTGIYECFYNVVHFTYIFQIIFWLRLSFSSNPRLTLFERIDE